VGMAGGSLADLNYGRCARSSASHAARCVACPRRALPRGCPSRSWASARPPALLVVARKLKVVTLAHHADRDPPDAGPGVEPGPERPERAVVRRPRETGESKCCSKKLAALIKHALLDHLICPLE
jgi:hypothetical protein